MNLIELDRALKQLRLGGMAAVLETRLRQAQAEPLAPIDLLSCLVSDELALRGERLLERRKKQFGHAAEGYGFGARGEENAWIKHCQMFGTEAQKALTTETRGQNSWFNFGAHNYDPVGNHKNTPLQNRPYAVQKVALLPAEFTDFRKIIE